MQGPGQSSSRALVGVACHDRLLAPHSHALPSSASGSSGAPSNRSVGKQGVFRVNDYSAIVCWVFDEMYLWFGTSIYLYSVLSALAIQIRSQWFMYNYVNFLKMQHSLTIRSYHAPLEHLLIFLSCYLMHLSRDR